MKLEIEIDYEDIGKLWHTGHVSTLGEAAWRLEVIKDFGFTFPDDKKLFFMHIDGYSNYLQALVVCHYYKKREAPTAIFWDTSEEGGWVVATSDREEIDRFSDE